MKSPATLSFLLGGVLSIAAGTVAATGADAAIDPHRTGQHAARQDTHADHGASHNGHAMEPAAAAQGPWSYLDRDNPTPYGSGRWEMVPAPDHAFMFQPATGLSAPDRCAALLHDPRVMVDRATRAACIQAQSEPPPSHAHETARLTGHEEHDHE